MGILRLWFIRLAPLVGMGCPADCGAGLPLVGVAGGVTCPAEKAGGGAGKVWSISSRLSCLHWKGEVHVCALCIGAGN